MMNGPCFIARFRGLRRKAFTLVEIVVSLTILGIIAAVAIPTMKGLNNDEKVREPVATGSACSGSKTPGHDGTPGLSNFV